MNTKISKKTADILGRAVPHIFGASAFFMGRVILFDTIDPVLMGYIGALAFEKSFYTACVFAVLGLATVGTRIYIARYIIAICLTALFTYISAIKGMKPTPLKKSVLCGVSTLAGGILFSVSEQITLFYTVLAVLEGFLAGFMCYIFNAASELIFMKKSKRTIESEELLSLTLILCCMISGSAGGGTVYNPLSLYMMFVFIFLLCCKCGFGLSISGSALMGMVSVFSRIDDAVTMPILILGSIFATVLSKKHRMLTPLGFVMGAAPSALYWKPSLVNTGSLAALLCASATLFFIPERLYLAVSAPVDTGISRSLEYGALIKEITSMRLKSFSRSFGRLSKALTRASCEKKYTPGLRDAAAIVDEIAAKTCADCKYGKFCWEQRFNYTYASILDILKIFEKQGSASPEDVPAIFRQHCSHINEMLAEVSHIYEIQSLNTMWQKRIAQSREMIGCQIASVAELIKKLWHDLDAGLTFDNKKSKELLDELSKYPLNIRNAVVYTNSDGRTEALITLDNCYGCNSCVNNIIPLVNRSLGIKMSRKSSDCRISDDNCCRLHLAQSEKLRICAYGVSVPKDKVCGDSYTNVHFEGGKYLLAISDGMGYGSAAREESAASIELYEEFVSAGFDRQMAVSMINSVLLMRAREDIFSTLDICSIDLYSGLCEFTKIGAAASFVLRGKKAEPIRSSSLPVGILSSVDTQTYTKQLMPDDIIIMVTDGVTEANTNPARREKWLSELLEHTDIRQPKELAEMIISTAKANVPFQKDDMTVLAARVW
ncbi:MAG: stage II sporulation protein E [Firmicutes bacterium]|nr:stage II sporulation protein E [Bacillota bacterium]